jgi:DNA-binding GntR family transcriptional regulator
MPATFANSIYCASAGHLNEQCRSAGPGATNYDTMNHPTLAPLYPINRQVLHEAVTEHLRQMILEGVLAPGMRLNERSLCATLGVSRTPLRDALKILAVEGLIDYAPNRGVTVATLSERDIFETFEVLGVIEALAGELACARITDQELADIRVLHDKMVACHLHQDLSGYYQLNRAIHDRISEAAQNSVLRQTYVTLNRRVQALRFRSNFDRQNWDRAMSDHTAMIVALESRNAEGLAGLLRAHLTHKRDAVLRDLATVEPPKEQGSDIVSR